MNIKNFNNQYKSMQLFQAFPNMLLQKYDFDYEIKKGLHKKSLIFMYKFKIRSILL